MIRARASLSPRVTLSRARVAQRTLLRATGTLILALAVMIALAWRWCVRARARDRSVRVRRARSVRYGALIVEMYVPKIAADVDGAMDGAVASNGTSRARPSASGANTWAPARPNAANALHVGPDGQAFVEHTTAHR